MNNVNISKNLEKSQNPSSIIITDTNNKPTYSSIGGLISSNINNTLSVGVDGKLLSTAANLNVITTVQPTPTPTGNTSNLNSTFKDSNGTTWIVDSNGDAVAAGSVVTLDGNATHIVRANTTTGVAPTTIEIPSPILGDTGIVFLSNNTTEFWSYNGTIWSLNKTLLGSSPRNRIVQALTAGNNIIALPNANTSGYWMTEVRNNTTGALITHRVVVESTTSITINVTSAVASARITTV